MNPRTKGVAAALLRMAVGATLIIAGAMKAGDPTAFSETLGHYRLLPPPLVPILALLLPWWELGAGTLLLLGVWVGASGLLAVLLFSSFTVATAVALARGLDIDCGCFGSGGGLKLGVETLLRAILGVIASAGILAIRQERKPAAP